MSHEATIHEAQTLILRELLFRPHAGFAELQKPTGLSSDNFTFHIKRLTELGYIERESKGKYALTPRGKEYANKLDTDNNTIERQPKVAVILVIEREGKEGLEYLIQQRLKHPYFEFWGCPTGKIRWGETIMECAARELEEETGLTADHAYGGIYHEHVFQKESGEMLEDKIFHVIHCTNTKGKMTEYFEGGRNEWMTREKALAEEKVFTSFDIELDIVRNDKKLVEKTVSYSKDLF